MHRQPYRQDIKFYDYNNYVFDQDQITNGGTKYKAKVNECLFELTHLQGREEGEVPRLCGYWSNGHTTLCLQLDNSN